MFSSLDGLRHFISCTISSDVNRKPPWPFARNLKELPVRNISKFKDRANWSRDIFQPMRRRACVYQNTNQNMISTCWSKIFRTLKTHATMTTLTTPTTGTAEGEGLVGPRPHHFFAPLPPLFENQILWFYSFFRFSIWKNYFQLSALPLFTLLRGPCTTPTTLTTVIPGYTKKPLFFQGHPTSIFGKYLFGRPFEI